MVIPTSARKARLRQDSRKMFIEVPIKNMNAVDKKWKEASLSTEMIFNIYIIKFGRIIYDK